MKIMSMNHYDMESSSRPERLAEFKVAYGGHDWYFWDEYIRHVLNWLDIPSFEKEE